MLHQAKGRSTDQAARACELGEGVDISEARPTTVGYENWGMDTFKRFGRSLPM